MSGGHVPPAPVYANVMVCLSGIYLPLGCEVIVGLAADIDTRYSAHCADELNATRKRNGILAFINETICHLIPVDLLHIYGKHDVELMAAL